MIPPLSETLSRSRLVKFSKGLLQFKSRIPLSISKLSHIPPIERSASRSLQDIFIPYPILDISRILHLASSILCPIPHPVKPMLDPHYLPTYTDTSRQMGSCTNYRLCICATPKGMVLEPLWVWKTEKKNGFAFGLHWVSLILFSGVILPSGLRCVWTALFILRRKREHDGLT